MGLKHTQGLTSQLITAKSNVTDLITSQTLFGREVSVVPTVALVEGVLRPANSQDAELALAAEFTKVVDSWNGIPVTLGHPVVDGVPVSANSPSVWDSWTIGHVFNASADVAAKSLKVEAWIYHDRVQDLANQGNTEAAILFERLQSGSPIEISTGLFTALEAQKGIFDGEEFAAVWRDVIPDHLAFLTSEQIGACSVADGCGAPRINERILVTNACKCQEQGVKTSEGAGGSAASGQSGLQNPRSTPEETVLESNVTLLTSTLDVLKGLLKKFGNKTEFRQDAAISDVDTRKALTAALIAEGAESAWVAAIFPDKFVYEKDWASELSQRSYSIADDGTITLGSDTVAVRPVTEFVPIVITAENVMSTNESENEAVVNAPVVEKVPTQLTLEDALKSLSEDDRVKVAEALKAAEVQKEALITDLKASNRCTFSDDELRAMSALNLQKMRALMSSDYTGQAGGSSVELAVASSGDVDKYCTPPMPVFPVPKSTH